MGSWEPAKVGGIIAGYAARLETIARLAQ